MVNKYYLSTISVSNKHGGGLTMQRILGKGLNGFDRFIHLHEFASRLPIIEELREKQDNIFENFPDELFLMTTRWSATYFKRRMSMFYLGWRLNALRGYSFTDYYYNQLAKRITKKYDFSNAKAFFVPQDAITILTANAIYKNTKVPYATYIMDDHVVKFEKGWCYPDEYERAFAFHLQHAKKIFVISESMHALYKQRFGVESSVLFGPADQTLQPVYNGNKNYKKVRLAYFGAIWDWQRDPLEWLADHLATLDAELDIYTAQTLPESLNKDRVTNAGMLKPEHVIERMREYDAVIIPISFREELRHLAELNIATKMSECLASGVVTLVIGPSYAAMVAFLTNHGGALIINDLADSEQIKQISLVKDTAFRKKILDEASYISNQITSTQAMRHVWQEGWNSF